MDTLVADGLVKNPLASEKSRGFYRLRESDPVSTSIGTSSAFRPGDEVPVEPCRDSEKNPLTSGFDFVK
jgi:hypothetical protein